LGKKIKEYGIIFNKIDKKTAPIGAVFNEMSKKCEN